MDVTCDFEVKRGGFTLRADLTVPTGTTLALIGPSGAGKSLFLGALCGFEDVKGALAFGGQSMHAVPPEKRPLSVMFQSHNLFPHLSVFDNVALGRNVGLKLNAQDRLDVEDALASVDLDGFGLRYPESLSGGQASRVALARAVLRAQPILLLDEPFSALGPRLRRDMLDMVMNLQRAKRLTLIYVTHDPTEANAASLTSFVNAGVVSAPQNTQKLFDNPPQALADYL